MKKLICFSLWGDDPKYTVGAIKNAELASEVYPEWLCRFYVGQSVPKEICTSLMERENVELIAMNEGGNWTGMFWRFLAASDPEASIILSRDTDSRLGPRERLAVDEWLDSEKSFHIMRDSPGHCTQILGGMWGVRSPKLAAMESLVEKYNKGNFWQVDQHFLRDVIYPIIKDDAFVHDEFFHYDQQAKNFPTERTAQNFVGKAFDADDSNSVGGNR